MRALVIQKPGEALIENIPQPEPRPGQVLLRVRMIGLCGSDLNCDIVAIFGCGGVGLGAVAASHFAGALTEDFACVIQMLESGAFPVEQAVGTIVPLDQAPVILKQWSESPQRFTKIMVSLD
jgi:threonine dehydrogenase-like Zn-dependent dehydrogenase